MLPKTQKIKREQFLRTQKIGKRACSDMFSVVYTKKENKNAHTKCAVVVSKKISKKAVERNKIKRKIYTILREISQKYKGLDVVLYVNKNISEAEIEKLSGKTNE